MKTKLLISILILAATGSVYAGTTHTHSFDKLNQVSEQTAKLMVSENPNLHFNKVKQSILNKLESNTAYGACCMTWYNGKQVKGSTIASHGHAVCVPLAGCQG